jgi:hypothetical protein
MDDATFETMLAQQASKAHASATSDGQESGAHDASRDSVQEVMSSFAEGPDPTSIAAGLEIQTPGEQPPAPVDRESILREARKATEGDDFDRIRDHYDAVNETLVESTLDSVQLKANAVSEALYEAYGDYSEPSVIAEAVQLAKTSPDALQHMLENMDETLYKEADDRGLTPDDDGYPSDQSMPSYVVGQKVQAILARESAQDDYEQTQDALAERERETIEQQKANMERFQKTLLSFGKSQSLNVEQTERRMRQVEAILSDDGVALDELAMNNPDAALAAFLGGNDDLVRSAEQTMQGRLLGTVGTDVASGFTSSVQEDRDQWLASYQPMGRSAYDRVRERPTASSIRREVAAPSSVSVKDGLTSNGKRITIEKATGADARHAERVRREKAQIASALGFQGRR